MNQFSSRTHITPQFIDCIWLQERLGNIFFYSQWQNILLKTRVLIVRRRGDWMLGLIVNSVCLKATSEGTWDGKEIKLSATER